MIEASAIAGDEDECCSSLFQEKRARLTLNTFDDSFVINVDGRSLDEEVDHDDYSRSAFGGLQDHHSIAADCSTSGGDGLEDSFMLRDFPHPRHVCVVFPFIPPPCVSNSSHCNKVS